jgi:hypothetical protein
MRRAEPSAELSLWTHLIIKQIIVSVAESPPFLLGEAKMEDLDYLRARLREESEAARQATQARVRLRHLELAAAYEFRISSMVRMSSPHMPVLQAI